MTLGAEYWRDRWHIFHQTYTEAMKCEITWCYNRYTENMFNSEIEMKIHLQCLFLFWTANVFSDVMPLVLWSMLNVQLVRSELWMSSDWIYVKVHVMSSDRLVLILCIWLTLWSMQLFIGTAGRMTFLLTIGFWVNALLISCEHVGYLGFSLMQMVFCLLCWFCGFSIAWLYFSKQFITTDSFRKYTGCTTEHEKALKRELL